MRRKTKEKTKEKEKRRRSNVDAKGFRFSKLTKHTFLFFFSCLFFGSPSFTRCITRAMNDPEEPLNSVSKIDRLSRWEIFDCLGMCEKCEKGLKHSGGGRHLSPSPKGGHTDCWGMCEKCLKQLWMLGKRSELHRPRKIADQSNQGDLTLEDLTPDIWLNKLAKPLWTLGRGGFRNQNFLNQGNLPPELHHYQHLLLEHLPWQVASSSPLHFDNC